MQEEIFKDLKVIELASVLAGPSVGMFFAELGASVIKIENKKTGGDVTRNWRLASENTDQQSAYFSSINFGKEHVFLDYSDLEDHSRLLKLIRDADIVICNFKQNGAAKFQLDYESLKSTNAQLIYCQLDGFKSVPKRVAFDVVLQAETGYMFMNGQPHSAPTKMPLALMDILAAHQLKEGILTAIIKRYKTGKGSLVKCSLETAAIASLANQASNYLMANHIPQRIGSLHPNIAPYGEVHKTKDNKLVVLAIGSEVQFKKLLQILNLEHLVDDSRFISNKSRVENRENLFELMVPAFAEWDVSDLMKSCISKQIPIGQVKNLEQVFESKIAQNLILEENVEGQITKRVQSVAFRID